MKNKKILVMSGDPHWRQTDEWVRSALYWMLNSGYTALTVSNPEELIPAVEQADLIVLGNTHGDTNLALVPDLSLRQKTIVLYCTGRIPDAVQHMKAGFFDFKEKHYTKEGFLEMIALALQELEARRAKS